ncbi:Rv3235 family protein [Microcella daejeonensis]|uniref:Rv3235 family protein n=1 Tax=Microcella daejeonensis TaxID=2994971 RepID=UPI002271D057|nr:Rv3235 family protein [Microcella daejeonensis]WAB83993.1 Rv3235 family protein [Microcella daejeonensis]
MNAPAASATATAPAPRADAPALTRVEDAAGALPRAPRQSARSVAGRIAQEEFFDYQPTSTAELPDPRPLVENLTRFVVEILAGARELEQIARWVTDDVYRTLLKRQAISARARAARGRPVIRPAFAIGSVILCEPRDGIIEAVVVVNSRARSRAVAIRLEGLDRRWRASAIHVL